MWTKKKDAQGNAVKTDGKLNDLWALGITFYKLLTGHYPFKGSESVMEMKE